MFFPCVIFDRFFFSQIASLTYWKALWPFIVFILATGSRLVQYLLHARSWSNYSAKALWYHEDFVNSQIAHNIEYVLLLTRHSLSPRKCLSGTANQCWRTHIVLISERNYVDWKGGRGSSGAFVPVYSLLMPAGQVLLMPRPGIGRPWFPYMSRRFPDTGSCWV